MVVTKKTDLNILLKYVKMIDQDAFISVSSVAGVYGKGFDAIKVSRRSASDKSADASSKS